MLRFGNFNKLLLSMLVVVVAQLITQQVAAVIEDAESRVNNPLNSPHVNNNNNNEYIDLEFASDYTDDMGHMVDDYDLYDTAANKLYNNQKRSSRFHVFRRGCIPRGGACDNRPNDCCYNSSCRCNLWGSNCRCQRMGLFQKWG